MNLSFTNTHGVQNFLPVVESFPKAFLSGSSLSHSRLIRPIPPVFLAIELIQQNPAVEILFSSNALIKSWDEVLSLVFTEELVLRKSVSPGIECLPTHEYSQREDFDLQASQSEKMIPFSIDLRSQHQQRTLTHS